MELKFYLYCTADLALIVTSFICGVKYFRKRNGLLGFESLVVTFSATNLMINAFTGKAVFSVSRFSATRFQEASACRSSSLRA